MAWFAEGVRSVIEVEVTDSDGQTAEVNFTS